MCDFRLGTVVTSDHETHLTGYEPKKDLNLVNTEELDLAATSDVYWQHTLDDTASFPNDPDVDDNQLAEFLAVVVDRTGKPVEVRSNNDQFSRDIRNLKSAQSQFPLVTQPEMICQTGRSVQARIAEERESSLRWTSSRRSIGLYPSKNGRCSQIIENSKIGVARHLDSSTTTQMAKIMVQYGRPVVPLERNLYGHPLAGPIMGKAI